MSLEHAVNNVSRRFEGGAKEVTVTKEEWLLIEDACKAWQIFDSMLKDIEGSLEKSGINEEIRNAFLDNDDDTTKKTL
jgi:hypothetical protein